MLAVRKGEAQVTAADRLAASIAAGDGERKGP